MRSRGWSPLLLAPPRPSSALHLFAQPYPCNRPCGCQCWVPEDSHSRAASTVIRTLRPTLAARSFPARISFRMNPGLVLVLRANSTTLYANRSFPITLCISIALSEQNRYSEDCSVFTDASRNLPTTQRAVSRSGCSRNPLWKNLTSRASTFVWQTPHAIRQ
jgi:hypothetical protein